MTLTFPVRSAAACLLLALGCAATSRADEIFNANFANSSFQGLDWKVEGPWEIMDYIKVKPNLANDPGKVARFPGRGSQKGKLTKTFLTVSNPASLTLAFDAGWGWGTADFGGDQATVMLLDDKGDGYIFSAHRTKAKWAAQWGTVSKYSPQTPLRWADSPIDGRQKAVVDGGALEKFIVKRDGKGNWTFGPANATGVTPLAFTDNTTTAFSQVVLCGIPNVDDTLFNNITLDVQDL